MRVSAASTLARLRGSEGCASTRLRLLRVYATLTLAHLGGIDAEPLTRDRLRGSRRRGTAHAALLVCVAACLSCRLCALPPAGFVHSLARMSLSPTLARRRLPHGQRLRVRIFDESFSVVSTLSLLGRLSSACLDAPGFGIAHAMLPPDLRSCARCGRAAEVVPLAQVLRIPMLACRRLGSVASAVPGF